MEKQCGGIHCGFIAALKQSGRIHRSGSNSMQTRILAGTAVLAAAVVMTACTTRPVVVDTPGPGQTVLQVPVLATANVELTNRVRHALQSGLGTAATANIDVRADQGTVYLSGRVATRAQHDQAVSIARGTADVRSVDHSRLIVGN